MTEPLEVYVRATPSQRPLNAPTLRSVHIEGETFLVSKVIPEYVTQADLCGDLGSTLVNHVLTGSSANVMFAGECKAGKSYALLGTPSTTGLLDRIVQMILNKIVTSHRPQDWKLGFSCMELGEIQRDLLVPDPAMLPPNMQGCIVTLVHDIIQFQDVLGAARKRITYEESPVPREALEEMNSSLPPEVLLNASSASTHRPFKLDLTRKYPTVFRLLVNNGRSGLNGTLQFVLFDGHDFSQSNPAGQVLTIRPPFSKTSLHGLETVVGEYASPNRHHNRARLEHTKSFEEFLRTSIWGSNLKNFLIVFLRLDPTKAELQKRLLRLCSMATKVQCHTSVNAPVDFKTLCSNPIIYHSIDDDASSVSSYDSESRRVREVGASMSLRREGNGRTAHRESSHASHRLTDEEVNAMFSPSRREPSMALPHQHRAESLHPRSSDDLRQYSWQFSEGRYSEGTQGPRLQSTLLRDGSHVQPQVLSPTHSVSSSNTSTFSNAPLPDMRAGSQHRSNLMQPETPRSSKHVGFQVSPSTASPFSESNLSPSSPQRDQKEHRGQSLLLGQDPPMNPSMPSLDETLAPLSTSFIERGNNAMGLIARSHQDLLARASTAEGLARILQEEKAELFQKMQDAIYEKNNLVCEKIKLEQLLRTQEERISAQGEEHGAVLEDAQRECSRLLDLLSQEKAESQEHAEEIRRLRAENLALRAETSILEEEQRKVEHYQRLYADSRTEVGKLLGEVARGRDEAERAEFYSRQIASLQRDLADARAESMKLHGDLARMRVEAEKSDFYARQMQGLQDQVGQLRAEREKMHAEAAQADVEDQRLRAELDSLALHVTSLQRSKEELDRTKVDLGRSTSENEQLRHIRSEFEALASKHRDVGAELSRAKNDLSVAAAEIELLRRVKNEHDQLKGKYGELTQEMSRAKNDLSVAAAEIELLRRVKDEHDQLKGKYGELAVEVERAKGAHARVNRENEGLRKVQEDYEALIQKQASTEQELVHTKGDLVRSRGETEAMHQIQEDYEALSVRFAAAEEEIANLHRELTASLSDNRRLTAEQEGLMGVRLDLANAANQNSSMQQELKTAKDENQRLAVTLKTLQEENSLMHTQLVDYRRELEFTVAKLETLKKGRTSFFHQQNRLLEIITDLHNGVNLASKNVENSKAHNYFASRAQKLYDTFKRVLDELIEFASSNDQDSSPTKPSSSSSSSDKKGALKR